MGFFKRLRDRIFFAWHYETAALIHRRTEEELDYAIKQKEKLNLRVEALEARLNKISDKHKRCVIDMKRQQEDWKIKRENLNRQNKDLLEKLIKLESGNLAKAFEEQADRLRRCEIELEQLRAEKGIRWRWDWQRAEWLPESGTFSQIQLHVPFPVHIEEVEEGKNVRAD